MRLHDFIDQSKTELVSEAIAFARTMAAFSASDEVQIRDHIPEMLQAIADDLRTEQTRSASIARSHGKAAAVKTMSNADHHGKQRAESGLSIEQLVAEYRALRSSVLRLWSERHLLSDDAFADMLRFNEGVDQAIAESVRAFASETEKRRQLFLGALGHDLRGPLNAILLTSQAIAAIAAPPVDGFAGMLTRSATRMTALLDSLLDYNVVGLGGEITLKLTETDLATELDEEMLILRTAFPSARMELTASGDCRGTFDPSRLREVLANLVTNACKYGVRAEPIRVTLQGEDAGVRLTVTNPIREPIPAAELQQLFDPQRRRAADRKAGDRTSLGLGLFITREIAAAHGGGASAVCDGATVSFIVAVPKDVAP